MEKMEEFENLLNNDNNLDIKGIDVNIINEDN